MSRAEVRNTSGLNAIPFDYYQEVFNAHAIPVEEAVTGSLTDDIQDIYRDVVTGLRAFQAGNRAGAL